MYLNTVKSNRGIFYVNIEQVFLSKCFIIFIIIIVMIVITVSSTLLSIILKRRSEQVHALSKSTIEALEKNVKHVESSH